MAVIGVWTQQPADQLDYDLDYGAKFLTSGDTVIGSAVSSSPSGLTVTDLVVGGDTIKLWVSGGTDGVRYRVQVTATTDHGRVKQDEVMFNIREF